MNKRKVLPNTPGFTTVGKVKKAHSLRGEVYIYIFAKEAEWLPLLEKAYLIQEISEMPGNSVKHTTYEIEKKKWHKEGIIAKLRGVDDRNASEALVGALFEVPDEFFVSDSEGDFYLREILQFSLENQDGEILGQVIGFSTNNAQDLAVVRSEANKDFLVPLIDDWIVELNREEKVLKMDLPEGLFDDGVEK